MTKKEKLVNVANIAISVGAIVSLLAGTKAISCLLFVLVLMVNTKWLIFKMKNKLWWKK